MPWLVCKVALSYCEICDESGPRRGTPTHVHVHVWVWVPPWQYNIWTTLAI